MPRVPRQRQRIRNTEKDVKQQKGDLEAIRSDIRSLSNDVTNLGSSSSGSGGLQLLTNTGFTNTLYTPSSTSSNRSNQLVANNQRLFGIMSTTRNNIKYKMYQIGIWLPNTTDNSIYGDPEENYFDLRYVINTNFGASVTTENHITVFTNNQSNNNQWNYDQTYRITNINKPSGTDLRYYFFKATSRSTNVSSLSPVLTGADERNENNQRYQEYVLLLAFEETISSTPEVYFDIYSHNHNSRFSYAISELSTAINESRLGNLPSLANGRSGDLNTNPIYTLQSSINEAKKSLDEVGTITMGTGVFNGHTNTGSYITNGTFLFDALDDVFFLEITYRRSLTIMNMETFIRRDRLLRDRAGAAISNSNPFRLHVQGAGAVNIPIYTTVSNGSRVVTLGTLTDGQGTQSLITNVVVTFLNSRVTVNF